MFYNVSSGLTFSKHTVCCNTFLYLNIFFLEKLILLTNVVGCDHNVNFPNSSRGKGDIMQVCGKALYFWALCVNVWPGTSCHMAVSMAVPHLPTNCQGQPDNSTGNSRAALC